MALAGGAPIPVGRSTARAEAGPATPVYVVSGGRSVGQKARRVVVVTSGPVLGGAAIPVSDAGPNAVFSAEAPLTVFVVSGSLS